MHWQSSTIDGAYCASFASPLTKESSDEKSSREMTFRPETISPSPSPMIPSTVSPSGPDIASDNRSPIKPVNCSIAVKDSGFLHVDALELTGSDSTGPPRTTDRPLDGP